MRRGPVTLSGRHTEQHAHAYSDDPEHDSPVALIHTRQPRWAEGSETHQQALGPESASFRRDSPLPQLTGIGVTGSDAIRTFRCHTLKKSEGAARWLVSSFP